MSRVPLGHWADRRITLLGDAASSVSLFGDGSALAMAGTRTLAEEPAAEPAGHEAAFARYEARHRTLVGPRQNNVASAGGRLGSAGRPRAGPLRRRQRQGR
ncbi:hypothetical protein AB0K23_29865 [Streptomyces sp. NPDC049602]|uniref:hypothetical protein n=1 Tax=Streptomyces sp. NPDC049602 TaxID=3155504 RepID=UPI0034230CA2